MNRLMKLMRSKVLRNMFYADTTAFREMWDRLKFGGGKINNLTPHYVLRHTPKSPTHFTKLAESYVHQAYIEPAPISPTISLSNSIHTLKSQNMALMRAIGLSCCFRED